MQWGADGWLRTVSGEPLPDPAPEAPDLPPAPWSDPAWDGSFAVSALPIDLLWLRTPHSDSLFSLSARPGFLRLYGRVTVGSQFDQALDARRQQHFRYTAATALE